MATVRPSRYLIGGLFLVAMIGLGIAGFARRPPSTPPASQNAQTTQTIERFADTQFQSYDGESTTLRQFAGKPLVINTWASWCPFCVEELLDFATVQQEFGSEVVIVAINRAEDRDAAKQFSDAYQVSDDLIFLLDPRDSFYRSIGGFSMPETLFVNRTGEITEHVRGPMTLETIREKVKRLVES